MIFSKLFLRIPMRSRNNNPIIVLIEFLFRNELSLDSMWFYFICNSIIKYKIRQKCYCTELLLLKHATF